MDLPFDSVCLPDPLIVHLSSNELQMIYCCLPSAVEVTKVLTLAGYSHHRTETPQAHRKLKRVCERGKEEVQQKADIKTENEITAYS